MLKLKKKGVVGIIFVLIIMIVTFLAFYSFLSQFFSATPELQALRDFKEAAEIVCAIDGPDKYQINVFLPAGNRLLLKKEGLVTVEKTGAQANPAAANSRKKTLDCPRSIVAYSVCVAGPTGEGTESIDIEVSKNNNIIALTPAPRIKCT